MRSIRTGRGSYAGWAPAGLRAFAAGLVLLGTVASSGCAGGLRFDARTIERRCKVVAGVELSRDQAVCMARLAGLKRSRRCPFEIAEIRDAEGGDAFRIAESCSGLALSVSRRDATVVVVELDRVVARYGPAPSGAGSAEDPPDGP